ncbi:Remorin, C-terminal [Cynara cardunculus var. scolymus]|uniref:Remorin, C-terminal n=1 Tax=Cynara cardunculus var. scolymus TaxID=59895 RepID=A0A103YH74_CYNCS|nr:Remorin, C-terminal [Cynara cardunculus var. scolymus]
MRVCYSPEFRSMNKDSTSFRNSGAYTSPGTPDYKDNHGCSGGGGGGFQKGWCSERVPLPSNSNRRRASSNVLMNGRTLPSKWDDAERWITSPVSGSGFCKTLAPPSQRRPKSKSGPLGDTPYFSNHSPAFPFLETNGFLAGSPFSTGVLVPNGLSFHHAHTDYTVTPSANLSSYPDSQDEKIDENSVTRVISRRDMATQMSPVDSRGSSPNRRPPPSTSPPPIPSSVEPRSHHSARVEVRDVEKEEARIVAWENLQTAKAEASIRKLEMKLEKKKSASMDRIMKKLRLAQMKAQEMRKTMARSEAPGTSRKVMPLQRYANISLISCFRPDHS